MTRKDFELPIPLINGAFVKKPEVCNETAEKIKIGVESKETLEYMKLTTEANG